MKKRKTTNKMILAAAAAALLVVLSACGEDQTNKTPVEPTPTQDEANTPTTEQDNQQDDGDQVKKGTGNFVGLADPHTVEIETAEGPVSFQLGEGMDAVAAQLQTNDPVSFEYTEKTIEGDASVKQLTITKLEKTDGASGAQEDLSKADDGTKTESSDTAGSGLAETKSFEFKLEGNTEQRLAKLAAGNGYYLYVFEQFSFDADSGKLTMLIDSDYHVEITKLPSDYNLDELRKEGENELSKVGKIREMKDGEINPILGGAALYLIADGDRLTRQYIVKDVDSQGYVFRVNMPQREASEGFGPLAFTSLSSIVNK